MDATDINERNKKIISYLEEDNYFFEEKMENVNLIGRRVFSFNSEEFPMKFEFRTGISPFSFSIEFNSLPKIATGKYYITIEDIKSLHSDIQENLIYYWIAKNLFRNLRRSVYFPISTDSVIPKFFPKNQNQYHSFEIGAFMFLYDFRNLSPNEALSYVRKELRDFL